jgi:anti-anti-sigma factor
MSTLRALVPVSESKPVIMLVGQTDLSTVAELREMINAQLSGGTSYLTIDAAGLSFADSASIRVLVLAAKTLKERGGGLVLLHPQRPVARMLALLGADQLIRIIEETGVGPVM